MYVRTHLQMYEDTCMYIHTVRASCGAQVHVPVLLHAVLGLSGL